MTPSRFLAGLALTLTATSTAALPPEEESEHVVTQGETLNGIANRARVAREAIIKANGLEAPYVIRIGQTLAIPRERPAEAAPIADKGASRVIPPREMPSLADADSHVVEPGETLGGIALRARIPRVLIAEANGLAPPYTVRVGQKLVLPRTRHHEVKAGDTGFGIAYAYGVPWDQIAIANGMEKDAPLSAGKTLLIPTVITPPPAPLAAQPAPAASRFAWPVSGPVRRGFTARGSGSYHDGIDISAPRDTAVRAAAAGTVIFARKEPDQFGNLVVVDHGDGWASAYASLGRITVKQGHKVARGERVGLVGATSVTGKTELHFELRKDGKPVDPAGELPAP